MSDTLLYEIESNDPKYLKIVAREGTNPIKPPNSVVLKRYPNVATGSMIEVYGILNPNFSILDEEKKPKPQIPTALITVTQEKGTNLGETLTVPSAVYETPKTPLDKIRKQARENNTIYTNFPSLVGQKIEGMEPSKVPNDTATGRQPISWIVITAIVFIITLISAILLFARYKIYHKLPWELGFI